ncbi:MAG: hypothetical protein KC438_12095, partial [Thermomicrobiales bacterium]|nr:hypothetical protein [Thermomicrobiales bacterium]
GSGYDNTHRWFSLSVAVSNWRSAVGGIFSRCVIASPPAEPTARAKAPFLSQHWERKGVGGW